jgi:predicted DNA binding CopG/RHH family protein
MKKNIKENHNKPVGSLSKIPDFLPPPEKLLAAERTVKVTLALDQNSLKFFKTRAAKLGTKYQKMIREVIKGYASYYS